MFCFCDHCNRSVRPVYLSGEREVTIRSESIKVSYQKPVCPNCCAEIFDDEVEAYISTQAITQYKRRMRMVPSDELAKFLKKQDPERIAEQISCAAKDLIGASHGALLSKDVDARLKNIMKKSA